MGCAWIHALYFLNKYWICIFIHTITSGHYSIFLLPIFFFTYYSFAIRWWPASPYVSLRRSACPAFLCVTAYLRALRCLLIPRGMYRLTTYTSSSSFSLACPPPPCQLFSFISQDAVQLLHLGHCFPLSSSLLSSSPLSSSLLC